MVGQLWGGTRYNTFELRCGDQLGFAKAVARGVVEQNGISLSFPNSGKFHGPWAMEAEENSTRSAPSDKNSLGDGKGSDVKIFVAAENFVDIVS